jgi:protein gp37
MCVGQRVPFFFKQWGTWSAEGCRGSKVVNGRLLDGRTWDEMPSHKGNKPTHAVRAA